MISIELIIFIFMVLVAVVCFMSLLMGIGDLVSEHKKKKLQKLKEQEKEESKQAFIDMLVSRIKTELNIEGNELKSFTHDELKNIAIIKSESESEKEILPSEEKSVIQDNVAEQEVNDNKNDDKHAEVETDKLVEQTINPSENESQSNESGNEKTLTIGENAVVFASNKNMTLEEKYNNLSIEQKEYYDDIASYAFNKKGVKVIENNRYEEYKIGNNKLVKLEIKKDVVVASFVFIDQELKKYARENDVAIKPKATTVKVKSEKDVSFVKDSIDMVEKDIEQDIIARKELQKQKRKEKALQKKQNTTT